MQTFEGCGAFPDDSGTQPCMSKAFELEEKPFHQFSSMLQTRQTFDEAPVLPTALVQRRINTVRDSV